MPHFSQRMIPQETPPAFCSSQPLRATVPGVGCSAAVGRVVVAVVVDREFGQPVGRVDVGKRFGQAGADHGSQREGAYEETHARGIGARGDPVEAVTVKLPHMSTPELVTVERDGATAVVTLEPA